MLNHITLIVSDLKKSKDFFTAALEPLGYKLLVEKEAAAGFGQIDGEGARDFWIKKGEVSGTKSFSCLAFTASTKEEVDNFYRASLEAGGQDNGAPGYRPRYHAGYYAAFVFDPDGHNIEVVWDDLTKLKEAEFIAPHEL